MIYNYLNRICEDDWQVYATALNIEPIFIEKLQVQLQYTLTGLLLFYYNRNRTSSYEDFTDITKKQMQYIWE